MAAENPAAHTADVRVTDNPAEGQYEAWIGGDLAGTAQYMRSPEVIAFTHTEVGEAYEGLGVGGALARTSLDAARAQGLKVVPVCPFIAGWIRRHADYQDLVYEKDGERA